MCDVPTGPADMRLFGFGGRLHAIFLGHPRWRPQAAESEQEQCNAAEGSLLPYIVPIRVNYDDSIAASGNSYASASSSPVPLTLERGAGRMLAFEKLWMPFEYGGTLYALREIWPVHDVK